MTITVILNLILMDFFKDKQTGQTLLTGSRQGRLYHLWLSSSLSGHQLYFGECTTDDVRHARLGHTCYTIFRFFFFF